ncbi:hypothetical protein [Gordonia sp. YC-JH1]|uniref:hypothetical protein n=1 Tax=Gordonia sp. YC-JH1 TaxID=2059875 RepID=UPI0012FA3D5F|nr:hypothetical protein [Gordonia sp. YC-JH1]
MTTVPLSPDSFTEMIRLGADGVAGSSSDPANASTKALIIAAHDGSAQYSTNFFCAIGDDPAASMASPSLSIRSAALRSDSGFGAKICCTADCAEVSEPRCPSIRPTPAEIANRRTVATPARIQMSRREDRAGIDDVGKSS